MNKLIDRISINPNICFGKPCIKGTRIWVSPILDLLANGMTIKRSIKRISADYGRRHSLLYWL
ncbi:hypothetical protein BMS3Abin03_02370 [bacterium BMS3Abin03]|nr:hypothetical protein BMS3Abin03_02370 [bacterium BMS3Abin03]